MVGVTDTDLPSFEAYMATLKCEEYRAEKYDVLNRNCNHFSQKILDFLGPNVSGVPEYIGSYPLKVKEKYLYQGIQAVIGDSGINAALLSLNSWSSSNGMYFSQDNTSDEGED